MDTLRIGKIIHHPQHRDAIHMAIAPMVAEEQLSPGQHVGIKDGKATMCAKHIGIVDPFLREAAKAEETEGLLGQGAQRQPYLKSINGAHSLAEAYRDGKVSIILDLDPFSKVEFPKGPRPCSSETCTFFALLVFNANTGNPGAIDDWDEQFVLVKDIEIVKIMKEIVPSRVGFYGGTDPFAENGAGGVYFSLGQGAFKFRSALAKRKLSVIGTRESQMRPRAYPQIIERCPEVVDRVSSDKGYSAAEIFKICAEVLESVASADMWLDAWNVAFFQRVNNQVKVRDVLIGPLYLEPCITKQQ